MNTVDSLLTPIFQEIRQIQDSIPKKDKKILLSLHKQLTSGVFLTENQGNLLVKILEENFTHVSSIIPDLRVTLDQKSWSKIFREVKKIKRIYISPEFPDKFVVEFSYNPQLREKISQLGPKLAGNLFSGNGKYIILLNEENLYSVIKVFGRLNFEIDEKLVNFYDEIKEVQINQKPMFNIFLSSNEKLKKSVASDVNDISKENTLLLTDRKIRYQYEISEKIEENTLTAKIANREGRKIFINSEKFSLNRVVGSLKELNRLPMAAIFDGHTSTKDKKCLSILEKSIKFNNISEEVGVYFRYNKDVDTDQFNHEIASLGYNKNLSDATIVAGISNSKIPKFLIKMGWKPSTVISFTNSFKSNRTYVYFSDVDLIIYYGTVKPLDSEVIVID
jgi:hypothetical protein